MDRRGWVNVHEPWGYDKLVPLLQDAYRVLYEAYKKIAETRKNNPYARPSTCKKWHLENTITGDLVRIAETIPRSLPYEWDSESRDPEKKNRIDITIIYVLGLGFEKRLGIECKRLDDGSDLCREYLGDDGVQRFVTGYYSEKMPLAGMIGYIQKGREAEIIAHLNSRLPKNGTIQSLEQISLISDTRSTYSSIHKRCTQPGEIEIFHLMLDYTRLIRLER